MQLSFIHAAAAWLLISAPVTQASKASASPVAECDRLASDPDDPGRMAEGVQVNRLDGPRAIWVCQNALLQNPELPRLHYQLARAFVPDENYGEVMHHLTQAANRNYPPAFSKLGWMHLDGLHGKKDPELAVSWFRRAAELGDAAGEFCLGLVYQGGWGVPRDERFALQMLQSAASQGYPEAQHALASIYLSTQSSVEKQATAFDLLKSAAKQGVALAQYDLGRRLIRNRLQARDYDDGVEWLQKAAAQGHSLSRQELDDLQSAGSVNPRESSNSLPLY